MLAALLWIMGQDAGAASGPSGWLNILFVTSPMAGVLLWLLLDERKERRAGQAQLVQLIKEITPTLEKSAMTLDRVVAALDAHWVQVQVHDATEQAKRGGA